MPWHLYCLGRSPPPAAGLQCLQHMCQQAGVPTAAPYVPPFAPTAVPGGAPTPAAPAVAGEGTSGAGTTFIFFASGMLVVGAGVFVYSYINRKQTRKHRDMEHNMLAYGTQDSSMA